MPSRLAVVLVNWNGWRDTIECLESLLPTLPDDARVLVCDNASSDDSLQHLADWAKKHAAGPLPLARYARAEAERGGQTLDPKLILIDTGGNLGFAGGNNVGIRYAMAAGFDYIWLLNNDTVVNQETASALIERMQADPHIGMCGSTMFYYDTPKIVQCLAGSSFDFDTAVGTPVGYGKPFDPSTSTQAVESQLDHIAGASMMVSRAFVEQVGLMEEGYFLYFEEIDWAVRAKGRFSLAWAPNSHVWHKEGGSIGSSHRSRPSNRSLRHILVNRLRFTHNLAPQHERTVRRRMQWEMLVYLKRRDWHAARIYAAALTGWRALLPSGL